MKKLREDRTAAERKMLLRQPAAGGESCGAGFFFIGNKRKTGVVMTPASNHKRDMPSGMFHGHGKFFPCSKNIPQGFFFILCPFAWEIKYTFRISCTFGTPLLLPSWIHREQMRFSRVTIHLQSSSIAFVPDTWEFCSFGWFPSFSCKLRLVLIWITAVWKADISCLS